MSATVEQAMSEPEANGETVTVTMQVPKTVYNRAQKIAARENRDTNALLNAAVQSGLNAHERIRAALDAAGHSYRARLAREGKLHQTDEEVMDELRRIREEVANELYPE